MLGPWRGHRRRARRRREGSGVGRGVSNVTNMWSMFKNASSFNQPLNKWNVSNVTHMREMFDEASSFNQPLHAPWYVVEQS